MRSVSYGVFSIIIPNQIWISISKSQSITQLKWKINKVWHLPFLSLLLCLRNFLSVCCNFVLLFIVLILLWISLWNVFVLLIFLFRGVLDIFKWLKLVHNLLDGLCSYVINLVILDCFHFDLSCLHSTVIFIYKVIDDCIVVLSNLIRRGRGTRSFI